MITRFATLTSRLSVLFAFLLALAACGGGGGGGGGGGFLPGDGDDNDAYFLSLALLDQEGEPTTTVSTNSPGTLQVKVTRRGPNGAVLPDVVVSADADLGDLTPNTSLSDSNGVATFFLEAGTDSGAGVITVSATNEDGVETIESLNFQIGEANVRLGHFTDGMFIENEIGVSPNSDLAYQGSAELSIDIVDTDGNRVTSEETITIRSSCLATGDSNLVPNSPLQTNTGNVRTTYTASECSGNDEITATLSGGNSSATATINIGPPRANSLSFVSAAPELVVLKGTGGGSSRLESSVVTFEVANQNNEPLRNVNVQFALSTSVGGLSLTRTSDTSDAEGRVSTTLVSGDVATVVRVIASIEAGDGSGRTLSTVSEILTVSTGLPDQNSISVSVSDGFVIENGFSIDGIEREITVRMADKFNNPVPDGTSALFTTEYGAIDPSCVTTNGACSVTWRSQEPRFPTLPGNRNAIKTIGSAGPTPNDLGPVRGGRSTILVTAIGEESFIDRNGNGIMDEAERDLFENLTEAYIDHNEDGVFNPARATCQNNPDSLACVSGSEEIFIDFNNDNRFNTNSNPAMYNGLLCPPEGDGIWCSRDLVNVRAQTVIILSDGDNGWFFKPGNNGTVREGDSLTVYISDQYNNKPPAGSTVSVTAEDGCILASDTDFSVPNTASIGAFGLPLNISGTSGDNEGSQKPVGCPRESGVGTVRVTLTPSGDSAPASVVYNCAWDNDAPQPDQTDPNNPSC